MSKQCTKCLCFSTQGIYHVSMGTSFFICEKCDDLLEKQEAAKQKAEYLKLGQENWLLKNIREAKERREKGKRYWQNKDDTNVCQPQNDTKM